MFETFGTCTTTTSLPYDPRADRSTVVSRKETFILAPKHMYLMRDTLACNGFYFTGTNSDIKCFMCSSICRDFSDKILNRISSLHFERCRFYRDVEEDSDDDDAVDGKYSDLDDEESYDEIDGDDNPAEESSQHKKSLENLKKENDDLKKFWRCRRCKDNIVQTLFLPCRHLVACEQCADSLDYCIYCSEKILGTVRTFIT